jgi:hypothetical protein
MDLKRNLVRAAVAGTHAVRQAVPGTAPAAIDPVINIVPRHEGEARRSASTTTASGRPGT